MQVFLDLVAITDNKEVITKKGEKNKWRSMEYSTKLGSGQLLVAAQDAYPEPASLNLNLKGWYKIYLGLFDLNSTNYIFLRLKGDQEYTPVKFTGMGSPRNWSLSEYMEEVYWKCADLTEQQLVIEKPKWWQPSVSGLAWIRCEEMTEDEIVRYQAAQEKKNKCVQMHIDIDSFLEDRSCDKHEHFAKFEMLKHTNMDFCSLEYSMMYEEKEGDPLCIPLVQTDIPYTSGKYTYDQIYEKYLGKAKEYGLKLYATERMSVANFHAPYIKPDFRQKFVTENKQYHCIGRDGSTVSICSYAFDEVQEYVINRMVKMVQMGFDGISMIYHRGILIGFESPVLKRFHELYPDIDPHLLPVTDERLHAVWCEFMTGFMRRVRKTLDEISEKHIEINVITNYGTATAKHFGIDVECWAKEGLIDSVSQGDMEIYEDLTDCMSDSDETLIDMEKYKKRLEDYLILRRNFGTNVEKVCQHMPEYLRLEELYGIKVYHVLPWANTVAPEPYMNAVEKMQACGAKRFLAFNTNHMVYNLPEFHLVSQIGNDKEADVTLRQYYKVLSLDDNNTSHAIANWRG